MQKNYYFAVFLPAKEGGYIVQFPDLPEAFTQGDDFSDAMDMARDVLAITVEEYAKARKELPPPTGIEGARNWWREHAFDEGVETLEEGIGRPGHYQAFPIPNIDMTPVRVSVSFPKSTLEEIDAKAMRAGFTRSGFLAYAAQQCRA